MMFYSHKSTKYLRHSLEVVANAGYYLTIFIDKSFIFPYLAVNSHRRYDKCDTIAYLRHGGEGELVALHHQNLT